MPIIVEVKGDSKEEAEVYCFADPEIVDWVKELGLYETLT